MKPHRSFADGRLLLAASLLFLSATSPAAPANPSTEGKARVMQGPMIGAVGQSTALIWARLSGPHTFIVHYGENPDFATMRSSTPMVARANDDHTIEVRLDQLQPGTVYYYTFQTDDRRDSKPPASFRTAPAQPVRFKVAFGSCAKREDDPVQSIWHHVYAQQPDLFFWLGDNMYGDSLRAEIMHEEYRRQRDIPSLQPLLRSVPNLSIWDDHDYGLNDGDRTHPQRAGALTAFRNYWSNPGYGLPDTPGVFFKYSYGGVDFFFLDIRYHRDPNLSPDTPEKTMLGAGQLAWLKRELKASGAPFKVLLSGSGWTGFKGPGGDAWSSYLHERARLFDFIRDESISGVFLLSGDTHRGEANVIPRSDFGGYDLIEFVSSPIAQSLNAGVRHAPDAHGLRVPYARAVNFGLLRFDLTAADPSVTFELIDAAGESVYRPIQLRSSQLSNGTSFWRDLIDEPARQAWFPDNPQP